MVISIDRSGTVDAFAALVRETVANPRVTGVILLVCASNDFGPDQLDPILREIPKPAAGGVFPALISDREKLDRGAIVAGVESPVYALRVTGLSDAGSDYTGQIDRQMAMQCPDGCDAQTVFTLVDGVAPQIDACMEALYSVFGPERTYLGGGTGTPAMDGTPSLLSNAGMTRGDAVALLVEMPSTLGVRHGWSPVAGPFRVTSAEGNVIHTLDWRPALDVYREAVATAGGEVVEESTFPDVSRGWPFGLARLDGQVVVRDPFRTHPDGSLECVGGVPRGSFVHVLHGDEHSLIAAAREASSAVSSGGYRMLFDCVSRLLYLEDRFPGEIDSVYRSGQPLIGACSIGEVANSGDSYLEFYNKTVVVSDWDDTP